MPGIVLHRRQAAFYDALTPRVARQADPVWTERVPPANMPPGDHLRAFTSNTGLTCFVAREAGIGWHLSISAPARYPTWDEIADARYRFVPDDVLMAMLLPPRADYANVHPNCMHLYEIERRRWPTTG